MSKTDIDDARDEQDPASDEQESKPKPELKLDIKVDSPSACQRHVTVTIDRQDIDRYFEDAFSDLMPKANVPGFRQGRAPRKLVESRFREDVSDQVKGSLLMDAMSQITTGHDFSAISEPDFDFGAIEVPNEGPMTFEFDLEVRPEFELPQWKGMQLERPKQEISEEDVQKRLKVLLGRYGLLESQQGPAEIDDFVKVNVIAKHEGEVLSRISDQTIRLRDQLSFRDGTLKDFGQLLQGTRKGDNVTAKVTISEDADSEALRGKEVEVTLEVEDVQKLVVPEMTESFLARLGVDSEEALMKAVRDDLSRQAEYHQHQRIRRQITSLLTESADWELPPDLLRRQAQREHERAVMELRRSGFTDEEIRAQANILRQNSRTSTATALKEHFILEEIAEQEEIEASELDYDFEIGLIAAQSEESPRGVRARYEKRGMMDALRNQIIERKVIELIKEHAKFKDVNLKPEEGRTSGLDHALAGTQTSAIPEAKHGGDIKELAQPTDYS